MESKELKLIFSEILEGYSRSLSSVLGNIKIKHLNNFDSAQSDIKKDSFFKKAVSKGLPERQAKIDALKKDELWDLKRDERIKELTLINEGLNKTKSKLHIQAQIDNLKKDIFKNDQELNKLIFERESEIGFTAEEYAERRVNEYYMQISIMDENSNPILKNERLDDLDDSEISEIMRVYNLSSSRYKTENIKKISLASFFSNMYYLCDDNVYSFFGKPVVNLTFYQIELFSYGKYFKSIIRDSEEKIPDHILEDPEALIEWADSSKNAKKLLEKSSVEGKEGAATSLVGASKEDMQRAGLVKDENVIDLNKAAEKKGGSLSMEDMMKLHGVK
tara:strand:- start:1255 stop:2253 length:999 start_codon:yes stop_codon:yes gene_type:complete